MIGASGLAYYGLGLSQAPGAVDKGGMAAALSTVAVCAPSDEFLTIGGPLAMLSVVVFGACASTFFMPASSVAVNLSVSSLATCGGIIVVSERDISD